MADGGVIEVVDATVDDAEIAVQNDMFERIMGVCADNPTRRVLQVLVDTLTCAAVSTGVQLDELVDAVKVSFADAVPGDQRDN